MGNDLFVRSILDNWLYYGFVYGSFLCLYLLIYKKFIWGILDPFLITTLNLTGGAFCVFFLFSQGVLKPVYGWSFIGTEAALFIGIAFAQLLPALRLNSDQIKISTPGNGIEEFDVFIFICCFAYIIIELVNLRTVGIVLLNREVNHVSAYSEHGIIRAFVSSFRTIVVLGLYYKILFLKKKLNYFELVTCFILFLDVITTGSKSAVLLFFILYFLITYPLVQTKRLERVKLSLPVLIGLSSFPILIVIVSVGAEFSSAIQQVGIRLMSSGDIFLLGYFDDVMASIQETSFIKYALYPGWGTLIKYMGFNIVPPEPVGVDVFAYYSGLRTSGANGRYNFLALHFFGLWGGIIYALVIGLLFGYLRKIFKQCDPMKMSYFSYLFLVILITCSTRLIDDLLLFGNTSFWTLSFFIFSCVLSKMAFLVLKTLSGSSSYA